MKKNYYLITLFLSVLLGIGQTISAQTTLVEGLIKVSDASNEYWYYIENGHNNEGKINDKDGRFCSLLSGYSSTYASTEGIQANPGRGGQTWKVIASGEESYYYLVNKEGNYLEFNPNDPGENRYWAKNAAPADVENCKIKVVPFSSTTPSNFVKLVRKGAAANVSIGSGTPNTESVIYESATTANTIPGNGLTQNPRSWRFVPEAEMEAFYPSIYPQNTPNNEIIEWYYIKSTDKAIADGANYLTLDPTTKKFTIAAKAENAENQLFGFVSNGYSNKAYVTKIVARGNGQALALSSSILTTGSTAQNWMMRHVFSTNNEQQMSQAILRTARTASGSILTNEVSKAAPTFSMTYDTYDNKYTWVYEKIAASAVTVTKDANTTILTGAEEKSYEYGQTHTVTYSVSEGFVPEVKINGEIASIGTLVDGVYTLEVVITKTTTIVITASSPDALITITAGNGITLTSPTVDENNQFQSPANLVISFTMAKGYSTPTITATGATVSSEPALQDGVYTAQLTEITNEATISIAATVEEYAITITKEDAIVYETEPAANATYIAPYTIQFTVADGYHHPTATVNGKYATTTVEAGVYTLTLTEVTAAKTIALGAFKANMLPVSEDTFVDGRQVTNTGLANKEELQVQYSAGAYVRRSYLSFSTANFDASAYNKASLQMVVSSINKPTNTTKTNIAAFTVASNLPISGMSWNNNGEESGNNVKGEIISEKKSWIPKNITIGDMLTLNVTKHTFESAKAGDVIRMQVAGVDDGDGYFAFHSHEGAASKGDIHMQPILVFERLPEVTLTADETITLTTPTEAGVTVVEEGASFTVSFSITAGNVPTVTVDGTDMTSELTQDNETYSLTVANITADTSIAITGDVAAGMDATETDKVSVFSNNGTLSIATNKTQDISIYSVQGQLIKQLQVSGLETITLPKGLYLVKTNGSTHKVQL